MERLINAKVESGRVAIHWLGQGGFVLKPHAGDVIAVDPYLSDSANADGTAPRLQDIPVKPKDVRLDYLFLTHDHIDHTDPHTAPAIAQANPGAPIICPASSCRHLTKLGVPAAQIQSAMPGQTLTFPKFAVHVVNAEHTEDSVGFVFEFNEEDSSANGPVVYLTGDTEYTPGLAAAVEEYGPDVLIVPINGRWGNMNAEQAAKLAAEIQPQEVIPMHYDMFAQNTADPNEFLSLLKDMLPSDAAVMPVIMKFNTCHIFSKGSSVQGRYAKKQVRSVSAQAAHRSHEHKDGVRGPNGGGIARSAGRAR